MSAPEVERLLTTREVAARLRLSGRTVLRLVEAGQLPVIALTGRTVRFRVEDVDRFLAERYRSAAS
ncbi:helix-turn-helix domain-containing protein [Pseudonocardia sp. C8]|uniref:helix-turn-helix transcriptional regulator n=1 Tax=Pseudonocardia sp. C8 TaxID=2762759 RepID=UPI0016430759|nr:helix-turn-helix domain-containing protein [Pseudonocardia sp. C8]MBC3191668.1 helix-turn-helix domain-containing protein [Pseudonocardia sp. C8]